VRPSPGAAATERQGAVETLTAALASDAAAPEEILKGSLHPGEPIHTGVEGDHLTFSQPAPAEGALSQS